MINNNEVPPIKFTPDQDEKLALFQQRLDNFRDEMDKAVKYRDILTLDNEKLKNENVYLEAKNQELVSKVIELDQREKDLTLSAKGAEDTIVAYRIEHEAKTKEQIQRESELLEREKKIVEKEDELAKKNDDINKEKINLANDREVLNRKHKILSDAVNSI